MTGSASEPLAAESAPEVDTETNSSVVADTGTSPQQESEQTSEQAVVEEVIPPPGLSGHAKELTGIIDSVSDLESSKSESIAHDEEGEDLEEEQEEEDEEVEQSEDEASEDALEESEQQVDDEQSIQTEDSFARPTANTSQSTPQQVRQPQPKRLSAQARFWRDMRSSPMGRLRSVSAAFREQNQRNRNLARQRSRSQSSGL